MSDEPAPPGVSPSKVKTGTKRKSESVIGRAIWNDRGEGLTDAKRQRRNTDFFNKIDVSVGQILTGSDNEEMLDAKSYMELYSSVYSNLVQNSVRQKSRSDQVKMGCSVDDIYSRLGLLLRKHMKQVSQEGKELCGVELLNFYANRFMRFKKHASFIDGIFSYMNRTWVMSSSYTTNNRRQKAIFLFSMLQWRRTIFQEYINKVTDAFFTLIAENRRDLHGCQETIKKMIDSYIAMSDFKDEATLRKYGPLGGPAPPRDPPSLLGGGGGSGPADGQDTAPNLDIYVEQFEEPFIEQSRKFYGELSEEWMKFSNVAGYMKNVEQYLEDEATWAASVLHTTTVPKVSLAVLDEFVRNRVSFLLQSFDSLVTADDFDSLKCMYGLLIRLSESSMNSTVPSFRAEMINRGLEAVQNVQTEFLEKRIEAKMYPMRYVNALVTVCMKHDKIICECFNNHVEFRKAYDEACIEFINRNCETKIEGEQYNLNKTPEQLSRFINNLLHSNNAMAVGDMPEAINSLFLILKYTESKDSFEKYYNLYLLERLIKKNSASEDLETSVITQLKSVFGADYSLKSFQLTQVEDTDHDDAKISQYLSRQFKGYMQEKNKVLPWDFQICIFRNGSCKLPPSPPFNIPQELSARMSDFVGFYQEQHSGRALSWYHNKSYGELLYHADINKKYTLVLSTFQMNVLLMYNENKSYTYDEIKECTQIGDTILNQILPVFEKTKLLTKNPSTGAYELFESYKSNKSRMDINIPLRMEARSDSQVVDEDVQNQRKFVLQAIMVRLMKASQKLRHTELIAQTITEASKRFKPNINTIKRTLEGLIEREYFKRDEKEPDLYIYIC